MSTIDQIDFRTFRKLELKQHGRAYKILNGALKNPYVLIAPAVIIALGTTVFALIFCIAMSFMKWDLIRGTIEFVGFYNYKYIFTDTLFLTSLRNTIVFMVVAVFIGLALKVVVGVFLNKNKPGHNLVQTIMFTPYIIATVAIATIFRYMMQPTSGVFNLILSTLGLPTSDWYLGAQTALMSLAFITIWQGMGYGVLIVVSGLRSIPDYVYEAARLDKSSKPNTFFRITVPLLSPTLFYLLVTSSVAAFTTFDIVAMMTDGGPGTSTYMLAYYVYMQGIRFMHYGRAMAASVVLLLITASLSVANFALAGKKVHYQ
ncbi:MAG TPA: sugar ABC transporter permease [Anaerovoracaceae bacterium]|nr:sugar ABC transporter permease [Bacillota bacterium]HRV33357.1 sugar ABC transporter permease [Anaerovoracaceae bacterium]